MTRKLKLSQPVLNPKQPRLTSLALEFWKTGLSNKPTVFRTCSSSANQASCTLLTLLHHQFTLLQCISKR